MAVVPDESITTFFPEPAVDDPTWAKAREGIARWLERSTLPRARAFRQFLNQNLAALAGPAALAIAQDMRTADFYRAHFDDGGWPHPASPRGRPPLRSRDRHRPASGLARSLSERRRRGRGHEPGRPPRGGAEAHAPRARRAA